MVKVIKAQIQKKKRKKKLFKATRQSTKYRNLFRNSQSVPATGCQLDEALSMGHDDVSLSIVLGFCCFFFLFHIILSLYCSHISRILIDTLNALSKSVFLLFPFLIKSDETIFDSKCIEQSFYMHIRYLMRFVYRKPICKTCFCFAFFMRFIAVFL